MGMTQTERSSVRADAEGWQIACWNLARAKKQFEVEGFADGFHPVFDELSQAYKYRIQRAPGKLLFIPLE
jgi:hypothetical protein